MEKDRAAIPNQQGVTSQPTKESSIKVSNPFEALNMVEEVLEEERVTVVNGNIEAHTQQGAAMEGSRNQTSAPMPKEGSGEPSGTKQWQPQNEPAKASAVNRNQVAQAASKGNTVAEASTSDMRGTLTHSCAAGVPSETYRLIQLATNIVDMMTPTDNRPKQVKNSWKASQMKS